MRSTVNTAVMHVADVHASSSFYTEVLGCTVSMQQDDAAILLTSGGFQIYLIRTSGRQEPITRSAGLQFLEWSADSEADLDAFHRALEARGVHANSHSVGDVRFVEGLDPDRTRVVMGWPAPALRPRDHISNRFYA